VRFIPAAALFLAVPASAIAQVQDRDAITAVIETWNEGWRVEDPALAASGYSDEADWVNAFGMRERGREAITSKLREIFALPFVMAGASQVASQEIRFVSPDVAIALTTVERANQKLSSGEELGVRHTSHQRVLHREDGNWRVVSHLISDARATGSGKH